MKRAYLAGHWSEPKFDIFCEVTPSFWSAVHDLGLENAKPATIPGIKEETTHHPNP
jgi:hypothetical protein